MEKLGLAMRMKNIEKIKSDVAHNQLFTTEVENIAGLADITSSSFDATLLEHIEDGGFWALLENLPCSLMVSREYEHFVVALDGVAGQPWQSPLPLPHPSGCYYDEAKKELIVRRIFALDSAYY